VKSVVSFSSSNLWFLMETLQFEFPAEKSGFLRGHAGVVSSGDLEVVIEPSEDQHARFLVRTSVEGYAAIWQAVIEKFFAHYKEALRVRINDCGATPGVVRLRLDQARESARDL
jgi:malonate decarboxylase delta subunit